MNLLWIGGITLFVLLEKGLPLGQAGNRLSGLGLIAFGLAMTIASFVYSVFILQR